MKPTAISKNPKLHYGWLIVMAGTLCIFAGLGFGRFALGMLLPSMAPSLNLTYSQMGLISTFNFIGYLLAVLACGFFTTRIGTRKLIFLSLLLVGSTMSLISFADNFTSVLLLYTLTGVGSGTSNVPMMALVSMWFSSRHRGKAAGFIAIGSGFAILLAGKLVPFLNTLRGVDGWRLNWLVLGIIVLFIAFICYLVLRDSPAEVGLAPYGVLRSDQKGNDKHELEKDNSSSTNRKSIYHMAAIYFLFGYTYVIYVTFMVTTLVQERGFSEAAAGNLWSWVGLLSICSGPVFGTLSDKLGRKTGLITVFSLQAFSYLLIALNLPGIFLVLSIGCFGIVAWSIPSIMAALVGDYVGPQKAAGVFGFITFIFAIGQIAGPYIAGIIAENTGSFSGSFLMAALFAGMAVILSASLKKP